MDHPWLDTREQENKHILEPPIKRKKYKYKKQKNLIGDYFHASRMPESWEL